MSVLVQDPSVLEGLGLESDITRQKFPYSTGGTLNIDRLIGQGAEDEDNGLRPLNHFYDPLHNWPLSLAGFGPGRPSPEWSLEEPGPIAAQEFSLRDAYDYLYVALTGETEQTREHNFGRTFEALGHVLHHLADMAQPQHVRNDAHCSEPFCALLYNPSLYESYTVDQANAAKIAGFLNIGYGTVGFNSARDFWATQAIGANGRGLAEFTNANFVSAGTNFEKTPFAQGFQTNSNYALPLVGSAVTKNIEDGDLLGPNQPLRGAIQFLSSTVRDNYLGGATQTNGRASTFSLWSADLERYGPTSGSDYPYGTDWSAAYFTLNRFNFNAALELLLPRAVAYSAGLIDHFFRGRLRIEQVEVQQGELRLAVHNVSSKGNVLAQGGFELYYDAMDGVRRPLRITTGNTLAAELQPGGTHMITANYPTDVAPDNRSPFVVVFHGRIGQELGVAGSIFGPKERTGFVFSPNYTPSDGVIGTRNVYQEYGQWVLNSKSGLLVGNIDWKGRYVNGVATRVLSWKGPQSRYFSGPYSFSSYIYQGGELWAVAPFVVLGAAINTDVAGQEWLVAIVRQGYSDAVYRRPNRKSATAVLYDPELAPEGWQLIGQFPPEPGFPLADRPWFFNSSGTEAQTLRMVEGRLVRLKIVVGGGTAWRQNLGNGRFEKTQTVIKRYENCDWYYKDGPGTLFEEIRETIEGAAVVAVDYKDDQEVLAEISVDAQSIYTTTGSDGDIPERTTTERIVGQSSVTTNLTVGSSLVPLVEDHVRTDVLYQAPGSSYQSENKRSVHSPIIIMDLRYDLVLFNTKETMYNSMTEWPISRDGYPGTVSWTSEDIDRYAMAFKGGVTRISETGKNSSGTAASINYDNELAFKIRMCFDAPEINGEVTSTTLTEYKVGDVSVLTLAHASYGIDSLQNLFLSMSFRDSDNIEHSFNYLTNGDPVIVIPGVAGTAKYYGIGTIR